MYDPRQWTDFFVLVGTGSATLAGLVFVAMTINLKVLTEDATHRYRAINMLSGFTSAFVLSALVLCSGARAGIYIGAVALVANFYFFVSGAWLLIVGTSRDLDEQPVT